MAETRERGGAVLEGWRGLFQPRRLSGRNGGHNLPGNVSKRQNRAAAAAAVVAVVLSRRPGASRLSRQPRHGLSNSVLHVEGCRLHAPLPARSREATPVSDRRRTRDRVGFTGVGDAAVAGAVADAGRRAGRRKRAAVRLRQALEVRWVELAGIELARRALA